MDLSKRQLTIVFTLVIIAASSVEDYYYFN
jgi:hypothetical protein